MRDACQVKFFLESCTCILISSGSENISLAERSVGREPLQSTRGGIAPLIVANPSVIIGTKVVRIYKSPVGNSIVNDCFPCWQINTLRENQVEIGDIDFVAVVGDFSRITSFFEYNFGIS